MSSISQYLCGPFTLSQYKMSRSISIDIGPPIEREPVIPADKKISLPSLVKRKEGFQRSESQSCVLRQALTVGSANDRRRSSLIVDGEKEIEKERKRKEAETEAILKQKKLALNLEQLGFGGGYSNIIAVDEIYKANDDDILPDLDYLPRTFSGSMPDIGMTERFEYRPGSVLPKIGNGSLMTNNRHSAADLQALAKSIKQKALGALNRR